MRKFDVIIGNPPYQRTTGCKWPLWKKFIEKSETLLSENGIMSMVNPTSILLPSMNFGKMFKENKILYFKIKGISEYFGGVGSSFCIWSIEKTGKENNDFILIDKIEYELSDDVVLPTIDKCGDGFGIVCSIFKKFLTEKNKNELNIDYSDIQHSMSPNVKKLEDEEYKYKVIHTSKQTRYSNIKLDTYEQEKIFLNTSGYLSPKVCKDTDNTQVTLKIMDVTNSDNKLSYLKSKLVDFVIKKGKSSGFIPRHILRSLPSVDFSKNWTDEEIYKEFNLSEEEIKFVEKSV